nr:unnamed protein product [Callosobruchus analis]
MPDLKELGKNADYFAHCNSKYGKCRLMLNPEMTLVASREMASSLPDSPKGLELACEALNKKFKNSKQVKEFEKASQASSSPLGESGRLLAISLEATKLSTKIVPIKGNDKYYPLKQIPKFYTESVPACGKAFLVTDQYPNYYDQKLRLRLTKL